MSGKYLLGNMLSAMANKRYFYNVPVVVEYSKLCESVLEVIKQAGYIADYNVVDNDGKKSIEVLLRIINGKKVMNTFKLLTKPGCRCYITAQDLKKKLKYNEFSLCIVSTSCGVMNSVDAVEKNIGGEVLCEIF